MTGLRDKRTVTPNRTMWKVWKRSRRVQIGNPTRTTHALRLSRLPRSGLVVCWACSAARRWKSSAQP